MFKAASTGACLVAAALGLGSTVAWGAIPPPSIGGKLFVDFTHIDMNDGGTSTAASGTGVDVKRFYLVFNEKFDPTWSANLTTDAAYDSRGGDVQVYVKKAYLQASLSRAFWARLGSADMPWIPMVVRLYGYRYVEPVLTNRLKLGTSADWGVHGGGEYDHAVSYAVSVVNGRGFKNPTRSRRTDVEARLALMPLDGVTVAVGGYRGTLGKDEYGSSTPVLHTATRLDALVAYVGHGLRLGAEYFAANDWRQITRVAADGSNGYSLWASYELGSYWSLFTRCDRATLSTNLAPHLEDRYFNAGLAAHPVQGLDVAVAYKHERMSGGLAHSAAYATAEGSFSVTDGRYDEIGVWAQATF